MEKITKHVKQNMIHIEEFLLYDNETIKEYFDTDCYYTLDTESCDDDVTAWVYGWSIGNTKNDIQIYGENLNDIYRVFDKIARAHNTNYKGKKVNETFEVFVHNLKWDFEFLKYSLFEMGYEMFFGNVKYNKKFGTLQNGTFELCESKGVVYSASIRLHDSLKFVSKRKDKNGNFKEQEIGVIIKLYDSLKIVNKSLKNIADELLVIDEMFKKGENYDYETIREKGHKLTIDEKIYLYNDVYILKEFVKQFYILLDTDKKTASAISFEKFLKYSFKQKNNNDNYKIFKSLYPDLTGYNRISDMINRSYKGGLTQCNKKFINKILELNNAVSIDRNSSYPSVIKYKMLPYGEPLYFDGYPADLWNDVRMKGYDMELVTIEFDAFANNDENDLIGTIQVGQENAKAFGLKGTEYAHTNIIGGKRVGDTIIEYDELLGRKQENAKVTQKRNYRMTFWMFELESMLKNMSFYLENKTWNKRFQDWDEGDTLTKGYEIIRTLSFKGHVGMFADAVDYFVEQKNKGKAKGNACLTETAKLLMNSFYGKMGSDDIRTDRILKMDENGKINYGDAVNTYKTEKKYYRAFASAVTAWGRVNLRETLYKVGHENVIYFDTDSLYTTITIDELKEKCGDIIHATELGKWDHEKTYNKFKCIGAKMYIVQETDGTVTCKCAGLSDEVKEEMTFENFEIGAEFHGKKTTRAIKGGYVIRKGTHKIRESFYN